MGPVNGRMTFELRSIWHQGISEMLFALCCCSVAQLFPTLCNLMDYLMDSTITSLSLKLMSIESVMLSNHFILCHLLLLLPSVFPSVRVFSNELALHIRCPKYWSPSFSISSSNEYWGFPHDPDGKESACNAGDLGSISGLGRSPGEGNSSK